jgi:hypothetical protein
MSLDLPRLADLTRVVRSLPKHAAKRKAVDIVRRMEITQSCIADLSLAEQNLQTLGLVHSVTELDGLHKTTIEHALLANACVLYARATATAGKMGSRGSVSIRDRLSDDEKTDHSHLVTLRNKALAHVHSNETLDESVWHQSRAFAVEEGPAWLPAAAVRRIQSEPKTFERLKRMIPKAIEIQREIYDRQIGNLINVLHEIGVPASAFEENLLDPTILFGSVEEARVALAGPRKGSRVGVISH